MKQPASMRRQPWVRVAVYSVMTVSVVVIVALLMLVVLGYSFNQRDGKLEQGGLLQFASVPTGASVTLDEVTLGSRTNTKSTVDTGTHTVNFDLAGYRPWKKTISIVAGQVGWVNYARLIPNKLTPESLRTFTTLAGSMASPKENWILLHETAEQPSFELANIQGDTVRYTTLALPQTSYTAPDEGKTQSFTIESWSYDEHAILIKHTYNDDKVEWISLNRDQPDKTVNLNTAFGIAPTKVVFAGEGNRLLFVQADDSVRRVNLDDQTLSRPLASNVAMFTMFDEKTIVYATTAASDGARTVGYATTDIAQPIVLHTYPADTTQQPLLVAMDMYFNKHYVTIVHGQTMTIENGDLPTLTDKGSLKKYATVTIPNSASGLVTNANGRFSVAQLPDGYATYDLELKKYDKTTWAYQSAAQHPLQWLDTYILWSDNGGYARIYDFDGANQQTIMNVVEGNAVTVTSNDKYFYGVTKTDKGISLSRVKLLLN